MMRTHFLAAGVLFELVRSAPALAETQTPSPADPPPRTAPAAVKPEPSAEPSAASTESGSASPAELAEIQAALAQDAKPSAANNSPPAETVAPPSRIGAAVQSLNPDISVVGDFALAAFSEDSNHQTGGHDPTETGFNLQQLELSFRGAVDPYFRFDGYLVFGAEGFELEEAYATTMDLPGRLQARVGQFLTRFGRLNPTHPHAWDFVDQPFALGRVFGGDGNRALGAEVSWLSPLPWYVELVGSITRADGEGTNRSFFGAENPGVKNVGDFLYVGALKQFFPLSHNWALSWGLSVARGPNASGSGHHSEVYGSDVYIKYRPVTHQSETQLKLQAEWLYRRRQLATGRVSDFGSYAQAVYRFARRWSIAARYEYGTPSRDAAGDVFLDELDPEWSAMRTRESLALTFFPTEFSRLRLQGSRDAGFAEPVWAAFLAAEFVLGAHGSHPY
ncbi:MAG: zinc-regulated TonB-dependent outer membrane receptor [Myxococcota bacterium]